MSVDTSTLLTAAEGLASTLDDAALNMGWDTTVCVTPIEPTFDCEVVHVWLGKILPEQQPKCQVLSRVELRWAVAHCIGAAETESCDWWGEEGRTDTAYQRLWGLYGGLVQAYLDGTLCANLGGVSCEGVRIGQVDTFNDGTLVVYSGTITVALPVSDVGS